MGKLRGVRHGAVLAAGVLLAVTGVAGCAKKDAGGTAGNGVELVTPAS